MPPNRTDSKASKNRRSLAEQIEKFGVEMFPCSNCEGTFRKCYVHIGSKSWKCSECVKRGVSYNVKDVPLAN